MELGKILFGDPGEWEKMKINIASILQINQEEQQTEAVKVIDGEGVLHYFYLISETIASNLCDLLKNLRNNFKQVENQNMNKFERNRRSTGTEIHFLQKGNHDTLKEPLTSEDYEILLSFSTLLVFPFNSVCISFFILPSLSPPLPFPFLPLFYSPPSLPFFVLYLVLSFIPSLLLPLQPSPLSI